MTLSRPLVDKPRLVLKSLSIYINLSLHSLHLSYTILSYLDIQGGLEGLRSYRGIRTSVPKQGKM